MRFILYGAGGVGGVIGAQLFKADQEVLLIARGEHLAAIQGGGLRYETPHGDERLPIPAVGHPDQIALQHDDVVVLTCKSQHTLKALEDLRRTHGDRMPIVCCQNGVSNERMALRRFANVYAMLVYLPAQLIEPGRIQCHAKLKCGVLDVGRYPQGIDERAAEIARRLEQVNFSVRPDPRVMRFKYAKLLSNLNNALEAISPEGPGREDIRALAVSEGEACLRAAGIEWASETETKNRRRGVYASGEIPSVQRVGGSSRQSLLRGTGDIEADFLNGEIVMLGRVHDIATPVNAVLQRLAVDQASRKAPPGSIPLGTVREMIEAESLSNPASPAQPL